MERCPVTDKILHSHEPHNLITFVVTSGGGFGSEAIIGLLAMQWS